MGCTVLTPDACHACYIIAPGGYLAVIVFRNGLDFFAYNFNEFSNSASWFISMENIRIAAETDI